MTEFKGSVFAVSNNTDDDEHGKFIFRWDETKVNITQMSPYDETQWKEYGLAAYHPAYTRHKEGDWTVITLMGE